MMVYRYAVRNCTGSAKIVTADRIPTTGRFSTFRESPSGAEESERTVRGYR